MSDYLHNRGRNGTELVCSTPYGWLDASGEEVYDNSGSTLIRNLSINTNGSAEFVVRPWKGFYSKKQLDLQAFLIDNFADLANYSMLCCSSGSDAVESAIHLCSKTLGELDYSNVNFVARKGCYHGNTYLLRAISDRKNKTGFHQDDIQPIYIDRLFSTTKIGYAQTMIARLDEINREQKTILVLEGMGSSTAVYNVNQSEYRKIFAYCRDNGIMTILDEVASGSFRHGYLSAVCELGEDGPDVAILSKAITNGRVPASLMFVNKRNINEAAEQNEYLTFTQGLPDISADIIQETVRNYLDISGHLEERKGLIAELAQSVTDNYLDIDHTSTSIRISAPVEYELTEKIKSADEDSISDYYCKSKASFDDGSQDFVHFCPYLDLPLDVVRMSFERLQNRLGA